MKQLVQNLKTGSMNIIDVPIPKLQDGYVLVRNRYSLISAGTEGNKVSTARMGYYGKAKEKPEQVRQVIETIKSEGISSTYAKVMNKLDSLSPLGYSTAGEVIDVGKDVRSVWVGDYVACAGANLANHAEIISVPENLVALVPSSVSLAHASYTTVASIAMQGIRQADLRLGESCVVIGLGLIGQITIQLLKASGVKSFGIDINQESNELAKLSGAEFTFLRGSGQEESAIRDLTAGHGADVVIITAATSSSDPVNLAGRLARKKGKIIIVGAVPTDFDRENYYLKELELKMATSYGPGRYDPEYEEKGHDYPIAYVRWTENRNMSSFVEMLKNKTVDMEMLTTHIFSFEEAERAYQMIIDKSEPFVGILLKYEGNKRKQDVLYKSTSYDWGKPVESPNISFIGAGAFAQNSLLPNIKRSNLISVGTTQGHTSANIATKWGFKRATTDPKSIISEDESNIIFIASRHHNHGELVCSGLSSKKSVFVEKPLCMTRDELEEIKRVYLENVEKNIQVHLMVGYNRRFSPCIVEIVSKLEKKLPISINYRINAGRIPPEHWIQDRLVGGGRIIGEVCHFIDLTQYLVGKPPTSLYATQAKDPLNMMDTINVSLTFDDGSIANISYYANGSKALNKEYLEVHTNGVTFILDDFKTLHTFSNKRKTRKYSKQEKGHKNEVEAFLSAIETGQSTPISFDELYWTSKITFDVIDSILQRKVIYYN